MLLVNQLFITIFFHVFQKEQLILGSCNFFFFLMQNISIC